MQAEANINQACLSHLMAHSQIRTTSLYIANNAEHHRNTIQAVDSRVAKLAIVLLVFASTVQAACFTGRVERVIDGDTIIVGTNRVRLAEIDAPEMKTPHGPAAKKALSDMILHKQVTVTWTRRGRYRRIIGQVYLTEKMDLPASVRSSGWVNLAMVAQGWEWQFRRYSKNLILAKAEAEARRAAIGQWK